MDSRPTELLIVPSQSKRPAPVLVDAGRTPPIHETAQSSVSAQEPTTIIRWIDTESRGRGRNVIGVEFDGPRLVLVRLLKQQTRQAINGLWAAEWTEIPPPDVLADQLQQFAPRERPSVELAVSSRRGIVRHFLIPRVSKRRRCGAALWEGKQLVPFPLDDQDALFGMDFTSAGKRGWWVTLVAIPRDDAGSILEAIARLGWRLNGVSLVGIHRFGKTQPARDGDQVTTEATVLCSPRRGSFAIFHNSRLTFHYDIGPVPEPPSTPHTEPMSNAMRVWLDALRTAVRDALDFYLCANPGLAPTHLRLVGAPEAIAPHVTDLWDYFEGRVAVVNPVSEFARDLPPEITNWASSNIGLLTPAILAASGTPSIDLTPLPVKKQQKQRWLLQYTRTAFVLSTAGAIVLTGLMGKHIQNVRQEVELAREESLILKSSPPVACVISTLATLAQRRALLAEKQKPPVRWMPWIKTVLATVPANGSLTAVSIEPNSDDPGQPDASLLVQLQGSLSPIGLPHALNYRRWIDRLENLTGPGRVELAHERTIDWKGHRRSVFTLKLRPLVQTISGWEE